MAGDFDLSTLNGEQLAGAAKRGEITPVQLATEITLRREIGLDPALPRQQIGTQVQPMATDSDDNAQLRAAGDVSGTTRPGVDVPAPVVAPSAPTAPTQAPAPAQAPVQEPPKEEVVVPQDSPPAAAPQSAGPVAPAQPSAVGAAKTTLNTLEQSDADAAVERAKEGVRIAEEREILDRRNADAQNADLSRTTEELRQQIEANKAKDKKSQDMWEKEMAAKDAAKFSKKPALEQALLILVAGVGGAAMGWRGFNPLAVWGLIEKKIDNDVAAHAQNADLIQQRRGVDLKVDGQREAELINYRNVLTADWVKRIDAMHGALNNKEAKANAAAVLAVAQNTQARVKPTQVIREDEARKKAAAAAAAHSLALRDRVRTQRREDAKDAREEEEHYVKMAKEMGLDPTLLVTNPVTGQRYVAQSKEEKDAVLKTTRSVAGIMSYVRGVEEAAAGWTPADSASLASGRPTERAQALMRNAKLAKGLITQAHGEGAPSANEAVEALDSIVGNPSNVINLNGGPLTTVRGFARDLQRFGQSQYSTMKSLGGGTAAPSFRPQ